MYKLIINPNRVLIVLALAVSLASAFYFPAQHPDKMVDIPIIAFFFGEMGLALIFSLLFYENATAVQVAKIAAAMLGWSMTVGAVSNWSGQMSQMLPDAFVLINWVQVIVMVVSGPVITICTYRLRLQEEARPLRARQVEAVTVQPATKSFDGTRMPTVDTMDSAPPQDFSPEEEPADEGGPKRAQSVKEILEGLDISRIMRLERSIHPPEPQSLEGLFKEESKAAEHAAQKAACEEIGAGANAIAMPDRSSTDLDFSPKRITTEDGESGSDAAAAENTRQDAVASSDERPKSIFELALAQGKDASKSSEELLDEVKAARGLDKTLSPIPQLDNLQVQSEAAPAEPDADSKDLIDEAPPYSAAIQTGKTVSVPADAGEQPIALGPATVEMARISLGDKEQQGDAADRIPAAEPALSTGEQHACAEPDVIALEAATDAVDENEAYAVPLGETSPLDEFIGGPPTSELKSAEQAEEGSKQPSLQELLKTEMMSGPLTPLDEEPVSAVSELDELIPETSVEVEFDEEAVEQDLNEAFRRLVPREALRNVSSETLAQLKASANAPPEELPIDGQYGAANSVASLEIADLIKSLADGEAVADDASEAVEDDASEPAVKLQQSQPLEVKDFGRLSAKASAKSATESDTTGSMKTIGKMLIDTQAVENIIKQGEKRSGGMTTAKIVSAKRGEAILSLLSYIDQSPGVTDSMIVGNDGLVIASTTDAATDKDLLGAMSLAIHGNSTIATNKLNMGEVKEAVLFCSDRLTLLKKLDDGILAVFSNTPDAGNVESLLKLLASLTRGKPNQTDSTGGGATRAAPVPARSAAETKSPVPQAAGSGTNNTASKTASRDTALKRPVSADTEDKAFPAYKPGDASLADDVSANAARAAVAANQVRDLIASLSAQPETTQASGSKSTPEKPAAAPQAPSGSSLPAATFAAPDKADKVVSASEFPAEKPANKAISQTDDAADGARQSASTTAKVSEFGRLSSSSGATQATGGDAGSMSIGKMLLDVQAVSNIIKTAEKRGAGLTTARVISAARGEGIRSLLSQIDNYPGVAGSLIVGPDGLVIASTLGASFDKDILGAMSTSMHSHTNVATKKLELGQLQQTILQSQENITILTNVEVGVLAVFCNSRQIDRLDGLLKAIESTIQS